MVMNWDLDVQMNLTVEVSDDDIIYYGDEDEGSVDNLSKSRLKEIFSDMLSSNLTGEELAGSTVTFVFFPGEVKTVGRIDGEEWDVNLDMNLTAEISEEEFLLYAKESVGKEVGVRGLSKKDILTVWNDILSFELQGETGWFDEINVTFFPIGVRAASF